MMRARGPYCASEALGVHAQGVGPVPGHVGQGPPVDWQAEAVVVCIRPMRESG